MGKKTAFKQLLEISTKTALYNTINMLLEWDQETYMPKAAIALRGKQFELLAYLIHKEKTSKKFARLLSSLIDLETGSILSPKTSEEQKATLREWRREYNKVTKLPLSFVKKYAKTTSASMHVWAEAKEKNNFLLFLPHLEKIIELSKRKADLLGYKEHPYDALVDIFEPNMTCHFLTELFGRLKIPLTDLLKKIRTKQEPPGDFLKRFYPHQKQWEFGKYLLKSMGFDSTHSRLDETSHPMCVSLHPDDIRMTTYIYPNQLISSIFSCIHEGGHGLYHTHLPKEYFGSPLADSASLGIDESQSRTWETLIGRSFAFWQYFFPKLQKKFPENLVDVSLEDFYRAINVVKPSLIRVESDEITYNLHIMVRFELEKAMIEGNLKPKDLPDAWQEEMRNYLGVTPKADSEGCLQDIHWSLGAIGYFPTYALGNLYAAQFFEIFSHANPHWEEQMIKGNLDVVSHWQKEHIHRFGRLYIPEDLCKKVTGKPLTEKPYLSYLERKYLPLYHLV